MAFDVPATDLVSQNYSHPFALLTNPHSPAGARGSYPERNMDAWYETFDVKESDKMYLKPEEHVRIW